jgi:glutathione S-transferase
LHIDGFVLTENPAILAYLGRRFPKAGLYPADAAEAEARCLELLAWSSNTVHVAYASAVKESGRVNYKRCLADIEMRLHRLDYALGAQFSVVDPFWLVFYRWGVRSGYDMRKAFPVYTAYAERLCNASVQRALTAEGISVWN